MLRRHNLRQAGTAKRSRELPIMAAQFCICLIALAGVGCSSGSDPSVGNQDTTFAIEAPADTSVVAQGQSISIPVSVLDEDFNSVEEDDDVPFTGSVDLRTVQPDPLNTTCLLRGTATVGQTTAATFTVDPQAPPALHRVIIGGTISGSSTTRFKPIDLAVTGVCVRSTFPFGARAIFANGDRSLVAIEDGTAWTWGNNVGLRVLTGPVPEVLGWLAPVQVPGVTDLRAADFGGGSTAAVTSTNTFLWRGYFHSRVGAPALGPSGWDVRFEPLLSGMVQVATDKGPEGFPIQRVYGLGGVGSVWLCNDGATALQPLSALANIAKIVGAGNQVTPHFLALDRSGIVHGWGDNQQGQLGDGTTTGHGLSAPAQVSVLTGVTGISTEDVFSLAVRNDGTVWAWGNNGLGQLGDGTTTQRLTPIQVSGLTGISAVAAGGEKPIVRVCLGCPIISIGGPFSVALRNDGTVWTWGANRFGQLGDGTTTQRLTPVQVSGLTGVTAIAAGFAHVLALRSDGTVWAWGNNDFGQLGDGTITTRHTPVQVLGLNQFGQDPSCNTPPPEDFSLGLAHQSLFLNALSGSDSTRVNIARRGYVGPIALEVIDCPSNVDCLLGSNPIPGGAFSSTLTFVTHGATAGLNTVVTVRGTGGGFTRTDIIELRLQQPPG